MRGGKEHARPSQPVISDEGPRASGSGHAATTSGSSSSATTSGPSSSANIAQPDVSQSSNTQITGPDEQSATSAGTFSGSSARSHQDVLIDCNSLVERYRKGEISKASAYVDIQSKLIRALGDDRARSDAAFGSFIATIESHDSEVEAATKRGGPTAVEALQRSPSPAVSVSDEHGSDAEPASKRVRVDESVYAWIAGKKDKRTFLRDSLAKTLRLIEAYTVDPKATKRSLINEPDCPEFPDSEWKNIISGRAVNLDAVLSGQLSTTQDDPKVKKFGDLEISFGAVEPTKVVKNGGDWTITWNRTVRATIFAFPHRALELTSYGEYIVNLFAVTHSSIHSRVIAFDRAHQQNRNMNT